jgi:hypothetical protein
VQLIGISVRPEPLLAGRLRRVLLAAAAAAVLGVSTPRVAVAEAAITVTAGGVTVQGAGRPLGDVLTELAGAAGIELRGVPIEPSSAVRDVAGASLEDTLARLLGAQSFTVIYGRDGRVRAIHLLGGAHDDVVTPAGEPAIATLPDPAGPMAASERAVPVRGRLARAVGAEQSSFRGLVELALRSPDDDVRRMALRAGLEVMSDEPELRDAVLATFEAASVETLAAWLQQNGGKNAAPFAAALARTAPEGGLRTKATAVLHRLCADGPCPAGVQPQS